MAYDLLITDAQILDGGCEEFWESIHSRSSRRWTVASNAATRTSSARVYAWASAGVRSHTSCDRGEMTYHMRHQPTLARITGWNHLNGYNRSLCGY